MIYDITDAYVLHVDEIGEYAMKREDGTRCIFIFTSPESAWNFIDLMELPEHKHFTAIHMPFKTLCEFFTKIRTHTQLFALDPPADCQFKPHSIDDFLDRVTP